MDTDFLLSCSLSLVGTPLDYNSERQYNRRLWNNIEYGDQSTLLSSKTWVENYYWMLILLNIKNRNMKFRTRRIEIEEVKIQEN